MAEKATARQRRKPAPKRGRTATKKTASAARGAGAQAGQRAGDSSGAAEQPLMKALRAEHRHMATVMQLFSEQLDSVEAGELVDTHVLYEIMDYMVTWPDRFHHPREDLIYARVAEVNPAAADEVDTLQRDHDNTARNGSRMLQNIERWQRGDLSGTGLIKAGRQYLEHIYEHMNIEEQVVFPHIEATLTVQDWRELNGDDELAAVALPVYGPKVQREFRNMTRKLRRRLRRGVERGTMVEWIGIEAFMESAEVVAMAYESARDTGMDHLGGALRDSRDIVFETPFSAPWRIAANNARLTFSLLGDLAGISRDTFEDLERVNQQRLDRIRLLAKKSSKR